MAEPFLSIQHVRKSYGSNTVVQDFSLDVEPGEVILVALFLLFFWIFSLGFAIYARLSKPRRLRP